MIKKIISPLIRFVILPALAIFLLYWAFKGMSLQTIWVEIKDANYLFVAFSFIAGYLAFVLIGLRWLIVLEALGYHNISTWASINSVTLTYVGNLMAPRAGEIIRCTAMKKVTGIPASQLLGTVILERIIDVFMLILALTLTFFIQRKDIIAFIDEALKLRGETEASSNFFIVFIIAACFLFILVLVITLHQKLLRIKIYAYFIELLKGVFNGTKSIMNLKRKWEFIGYTIAIWLMYYLMIYLMMFAFKETSVLRPGDALYLMTIGSLAQLVPVQGGIGAYHNVIKFGFPILGIAGITPSVALAFATLTHATQTVMQIVSGIGAFIAIHFMVKKKI